MRKHLKTAFTMVDLLLSMGLVTLLLSFSMLNNLRLINKPSLDAAVQKLAADIKAAQNQAMVGDSGSAGATTTWGLYFEAGQYTTFRGTTYLLGDSSNFIVELDPSISLSTTFANSSLVFTRRSGEVEDFVDGANTITLNNTASGQAKTVSVNRFGALTIN